MTEAERKLRMQQKQEQQMQLMQQQHAVRKKARSRRLKALMTLRHRTRAVGARISGASHQV
jgi:hypothetical protein